MPLLPYQRLLYKILQEYNTYELKSRGIGVTTFFLYWIAYCCTKFQPNDRVCIIVDPRIDSAEDLITGLNGLFCLK
jgi:hypothetical protein